MTLATTGNDGQPDARIVLLKQLNDHGLSWYTHYDRTLRANVRYLRHKISCPAIEVSGSTATSVCYLDADAIPTGFDEPIVLVGRYDDELVKDEGRWWFKERKIIGYYSHPAGRFSPGRGE
jgi:hypothetical protein